TLSALWCSAPGPLGPFPRCSAGYPPRGRSAFAETSSSARRRVDLLGQAVEPSVLLQQEVEVEEVVRHERRTVVRLVELSRQTPYLHPHPARHQQVDDAPAGILRHRTAAFGAAEAVRPALVVRAHSYRQLARLELHVTAARTIRSDGGHRSPSLVCSR